MTHTRKVLTMTTSHRLVHHILLLIRKISTSITSKVKALNDTISHPIFAITLSGQTENEVTLLTASCVSLL